MKEIDAFINIFGDITILEVLEFLLAVLFMVGVYTKVTKHFKAKAKEQLERAEIEKKRDDNIQEALNAVHKYPEYREQSIGIQQKLEEQINELKSMHKETTNAIYDITQRLNKMEDDTKIRERKKIGDKLLQNYRYYVNPETNPSHSWNSMEAQAFWDLFEEYEKAGGDGYMHSTVQPAMQLLNIVDNPLH